MEWTDGYLDVSYEDGSLAQIYAPYDPPVTQANIDISVGVYSNPDEGSFPTSDVGGTTLTGAPLWVDEYNWSLEQAAAFLGAPVTQVESYPEEHVLDHIVKTTPETRIPAGESREVVTPQGRYLVAWYVSKPVPGVCVSSYENNHFTAVLLAK
jgi:hypothetical protein